MTLPRATRRLLVRALISVVFLGSLGTVADAQWVQTSGPRGEYGFPVLRNGQPTGEVASRIERRGGKTRIFTTIGVQGFFKTWNGRSFF